MVPMGADLMSPTPSASPAGGNQWFAAYHAPVVLTVDVRTGPRLPELSPALLRLLPGEFGR